MIPSCSPRENSILFTSRVISTRLTLSTIIESSGATTWFPNGEYTLYPLYSFGLWLAVNTIPDTHPRWRTQKERRGVGRISPKINTLMPFAASTRAASSANLLELFLESYAIQTPLSPASGYCASR